MKKLLPLLLAISILPINAFGYGPRGHQLVGSIADKRLARNRVVSRKVRRLLDGLTLERVATLPDEIKSWNDCGSRPPSPNPVIDRVRINNELRAFLEANKCSLKPTHDEFHYTDVPVTGGEDYDDGEVGRGKFDIVQMIPFCLRVLRGQEPENNDRKITKTVAVILLTHYLGDIHQPLHVGAEFFDDNGNPFHPSVSNPGFGDQGGNKLTLFTVAGDGELRATGRLHSYWDSQTVNTAFGDESNASVATRLARQTPARWRLAGRLETWAEQMANDALPLAREARTRLQYRAIEIVPGEHEIKSGEAREKRPSNSSYASWSANVVRREIHKGGWRLADLLQKALQ